MQDTQPELHILLAMGAPPPPKALFLSLTPTESALPLSEYANSTVL